MTTDHYDVVIIIGSVAGGSTPVCKLAPTGKRIPLLERGDRLARERDNGDTEAWGLRLEAELGVLTGDARKPRYGPHPGQRGAAPTSCGGRRWPDRALIRKSAGSGGDMPSRGSAKCPGS
jgi:choline dehydrogenase-like flavoprotein